jgi:hypothetical protein
MDKNTPASVALWSGIAVVALQIISFCIGWIPFVNFLNLLLVPLIFIADIVAIVTGFIGLKKANLLAGLGKGSAIAGLCIGGLHLLLVVVVLVVSILIGGLAFLGSILSSL